MFNSKSPAIKLIAAPREQFSQRAAPNMLSRFFKIITFKMSIHLRKMVEQRRNCTVGLHLGAGGDRIEGLINCDLFDPRADKQVSALDLSDWEDGTVDLIESHHMVEHLSFEEFRAAPAEWHRALRPGGSVVLTCPNITWVCFQVVSFRLLQILCPRSKKLAAKMAYTRLMLYGSQVNDGMFHKNAFNRSFMRQELEEAGFQVEKLYTPWPPDRTTPSLLAIARKPSDP